MSIADETNRDKEMRRRMFEDMIEHFTYNYRPVDKTREAYSFDRDLHCLVRQIYADAQAPLLEHLSKIIMAWPSPLIMKDLLK